MKYRFNNNSNITVVRRLPSMDLNYEAFIIANNRLKVVRTTTSSWRSLLFPTDVGHVPHQRIGYEGVFNHGGTTEAVFVGLAFICNDSTRNFLMLIGAGVFDSSGTKLDLVRASVNPGTWAVFSYAAAGLNLTHTKTDFLNISIDYFIETDVQDDNTVEQTIAAQLYKDGTLQKDSNNEYLMVFNTGVGAAPIPVGPCIIVYTGTTATAYIELRSIEHLGGHYGFSRTN